MDRRDAVATALAAAGVVVLATAVGLLAGWRWSLVPVGVALLLGGALMLLSNPDELTVEVLEQHSATETFRTSATTLGVEALESRQGVRPKIGHAIGQYPSESEAS